MGSVTQDNGQMKQWVPFFREKRLLPLIEKCNQASLLSAEDLEALHRFLPRLSEIFDEAALPRLQHGDLWSGNFMCNDKGAPVLIDPAVYFGHPAVDLGMTRLFGGFAPRFYQSYLHFSSPIPRFQEQCTAANLYPLLIHLYLFGKSYLSSIRSCISQFS